MYAGCQFKDLAGKRSQDPYAWCYLLGKDGRCYFQIGKNKTKCFDKNLNPDFHETFEFRVGDVFQHVY